MTNTKKVNMEHFIGTYDGYIPDHDCDKAIKYFEDESEVKRTLNRQAAERALPSIKKDEQLFCGRNNVRGWWRELKPFFYNFDLCLKHYVEHCGLQGYYEEGLQFTTFKIQKTLPTEGYHIWHIEHGAGFDNEPRALVYTVYLNDVEEGGETEFLHYSKRVKPKKGRVVIFPAGFPYVHRGNPPLSGEKYILTSWMMSRESNC
jgi:hypothetical protein|tara:strand:+ start:100 stop:708 length:609 start_codon:yes stop_codon:yes gene_type:complete